MFVEVSSAKNRSFPFRVELTTGGGGGVQTRNFRAATQRDPVPNATVPNATHQLTRRDPVTHSKPVVSFISLTKTIYIVFSIDAATQL